MEEIWKDIKGYEGIYQISNLGQVKSLHNKLGQKELIMKQNLKRNGYYQIRLKNNGKQKDYIVHRLVAQAFIDNPMKLPCINHIDENKTNNNVENLEWCTVKYNNIYGTRMEKIKEKLGKPIMQFDLSGNFIKEYNSLNEASKETKISAGNISSCTSNKYKQTHGYIWKYKEVV